MTVSEVFATRYRDSGVKLLHETLVATHGLLRSYNWLRLNPAGATACPIHAGLDP